MSIPGPNRYRQSRDFKKETALYIKIAKGEEVKQRAPRSNKGKPLKSPEADFRKTQVYPFLKKNTIMYYRLENSIRGKHGDGITDFIYFVNADNSPITSEGYPPLVMVFCEIKSKDGRLDKGAKTGPQRTFKELCDATVKVRHVVARSVDDLEAVG